MKERRKIEVICEMCKNSFMKDTREVNRTIRNKGVHCCGKECTKKYLIVKKTKPMSYNVRSAKRVAKQRGHEFNLTVEYIQELFDMQDGKCALSKLPMEPVWKGNIKKINQVSIDRVDNNKGYVEGNVQLVCLGINLMRNTFELEDTKDFIEQLKIVY